MKQKLVALRDMAARQQAKLGMGAALMVAAGVARAETTDPSAAITAALGAIVPAIMTAITTTISSVAPVIALAVGIAYAVRMVRKQAK